MKKSWLVTGAILIAACSTPPKQHSELKPAASSQGAFVRADPAFDRLVPANAQIEKLADGFRFIEWPVRRPQGVVWFSDVIGNVVWQWSLDGKVEEVTLRG
jgi:gluconolactonase